MIVIVERGTRMQRPLRDAVGLPALSTDSGQALIVTAVGAGGKTTLLHALAAEVAAAGARAVITTTTHMHCEPGMARTLDDAYARLALMRPGDPTARDRVVVAGLPVTPEAAERPAKFTGFGPVGLTLLARSADVVLVEGDGSRRLPFKVPAAHEPVVPPQTDLLLVVAGLNALGQPLSEVCCRADTATALEPQATPDAALTPSLAARLLMAGYLDHPGLAAWRGRRTVVLSHADSPGRWRAGHDLAAALAPTPVILTGCATDKDT